MGPRTKVVAMLCVCYAWDERDGEQKMRFGYSCVWILLHWAINARRKTDEDDVCRYVDDESSVTARRINENVERRRRDSQSSSEHIEGMWAVRGCVSALLTIFADELRAIMATRRAADRVGARGPSLSRSQVKMSCPGRSQISQTSSPLWPSVEESVEDARDAREEGRRMGSSGRSVLDDFFWLRASFSLSRSISRSNSSSR
ncbi:hypothetical protein C8Q74DRAFT_707237 [Fomes fomentarius]|nr:hypothetical protein C8Q74DRAFT_707237 [Fomes fomentarius]